MKNSIVLILALTAFTLAGCDAWEDVNQFESGDRSKPLSALVAANPDLSTFAQVLDITGYADDLSSDVSYTVFAPSNSALATVDLADTAALRVMVQNHLSYKLVYADKEGNFVASKMQMLSQKLVSMVNNLVSGVQVSRWNIASKNGVLHVVDGIIEERMNIWEYLQTQAGNPMVDMITSFNQRVMDKDRSVRIGVDSEGRSVYDTVWSYSNPYLMAVPLDNEMVTSTFLLLDEGALTALQTKYLKYFKQKDSLQTLSDILQEITTDMVLQYTAINNDGRYINTSGVLVDVNVADIADSYKASNGIVYKLTAADVKMYQNKIKPLVIEAEDFVASWPDAWQKRSRTWASGGYDMVLKSRTRHSYDWTEYVPIDTLQSIAGSDSIVYDTVVHKVNNSFNLTYRSNEWPGANTLGEPNAYIAYKPQMYSTAYKIFWKAYDDNSWISHIDSRGVAMEFYQKMYISFPGEKVLQRTSDNVITNHFTSTATPDFTPNHSVLAARMVAGENVETQLMRYKVNQGHTVYPSSYVLYTDETNKKPVLYGSEDIYGQGGLLKCPFYGQSTFFVSNTCVGEFIHEDGTVQAFLNSAKGSNSPGMIFLDYIRLEPQVDPND